MPSLLSRIVCVLAVFCALLYPASVSADTGDFEMTVTGKGWGHGVGFSQYGARAMADDGSSTEDILSHYFPGTKIRTCLLYTSPSPRDS